MSRRYARRGTWTEHRQSPLGEIGAPLKVVSFKLSEIAPLMPLIIAGILAAIAVWTAEGLRHMTLAARLVSDEADGAAIRTWLHAAAGGSRVRIARVEIAVALLNPLPAHRSSNPTCLGERIRTSM